MFGWYQNCFYLCKGLWGSCHKNFRPYFTKATFTGPKMRSRVKQGIVQKVVGFIKNIV